MTQAAPAACACLTDPIAPTGSNEPSIEIERDGVHFTLLGTAHVSRISAEAAIEMAADPRFDAVAVELCPSRTDAIRDPNAWRRLDLFQVFKQGKTGMVMASLALGAYQRRIAEQFGIEPGAEMKGAIETAEKHHKKLASRSNACRPRLAFGSVPTCFPD
jgi:pheromone shutdown protein TraB